MRFNSPWPACFQPLIDMPLCTAGWSALGLENGKRILYHLQAKNNWTGSTQFRRQAIEIGYATKFHWWKYGNCNSWNPTVPMIWLNSTVTRTGYCDGLMIGVRLSIEMRIFSYGSSTCSARQILQLWRWKFAPMGKMHRGQWCNLDTLSIWLMPCASTSMALPKINCFWTTISNIANSSNMIYVPAMGMSYLSRSHSNHRML